MEEQKPEVLRQYLASTIANIGFFSMGTMYGYSSAAGLLMTDEDSSDVVLSVNEIGLFASCLDIGAVVGSFLGGFGLRKFGRKGLLITTSVTGLLGWIFIYFATNATLLMVGRTFCGIMVGMLHLADPAYTAEIASKEIRGRIGALQYLMATLGLTTFGLVSMVVLSWRTLALLCAIVNVVHGVAMFFNYETPTYLLMKHREQEAINVLQKLRGAHFDITSEFDELKRLVARTREENSKVMTLTKMRRPEVYKPFSICLLLSILVYLGGFKVLTFNLQLILLSTGSALKAHLDVGLVIYGAIRIPASFVVMALTDRIGRKMLTIGSALLMGLSLVVLGIYFATSEEGMEQSFALQLLAWFTVFSALFCALIYSSMPFVLQSELLTPDIREFCGSIITATGFFVGFLSLSTFFPLQHVLSLYALYWTYAAFCFAGVGFTAVYIPETKNKSIETINMYFCRNSETLPVNEDSSEMSQAKLMNDTASKLIQLLEVQPEPDEKQL